jgi:hypothetical protein
MKDWLARQWRNLVSIAVLVIAGAGVYALLPRDAWQSESWEYAATRARLKNLCWAVSAFESDFGQYPPSRRTRGPEDLRTGAALLVYCLMGPSFSGWGVPAGGALPMGGTSDRTFGPYVGPLDAAQMNEAARSHAFLDSFNPPRPILYYRAEPGRRPLFDVTDNPVDATCRTGFAGQEHFEMLMSRPPENPAQRKWPRGDFLLISPGRDGLYGHVVKDGAARRWRPARPCEEAEAVCDDLTNF